MDGGKGGKGAESLGLSGSGVGGVKHGLRQSFQKMLEIQLGFGSSIFWVLDGVALPESGPLAQLALLHSVP